MHFYEVSGLTVGSEIDLPGLLPAADGGRAPDVTIRRGPVPRTLESPAAAGPTWQLADKTLLLHIPPVARFLLNDGREIAVEAEPNADSADIAVFITGTVFGILLHQRGQIVLHASAVHVNGKAVLFCGPSGSGKSTLAAMLALRGYPVLADDLGVLTLAADGAATVHPDGCLLKLWSHTIEQLDLEPRRIGRLRTALEKFYVMPQATVSHALPLGAVYVLRETRPPHASGIERPNVVDAALFLRRGAYRPLIVGVLEQRPLYFRAATIANHAGIFLLTRPFDFERSPDVLGWLEQHWRNTGVSERAA